MKIIEIHVYGFGKLIDFHLTNLSDFQVIYGKNEAGKSTLMAFIHSVLFGFPTKQQQDLRYEPKTHSAYGGQLVLLTEKYGKVLVERVKGKATGEVTVTMENGQIGGEELLSIVLNHLNKSMFQSIFSFNIHGLQNMNKLKGEDISRYLFAAGTIGTDSLLKAEQEIQKEMDTLFKPNGRKPVINQLLHELRSREKELNELKIYNGQYEMLKHKQLSLESERSAIQEKIEHHQRELQTVEKMINEWPLYKEKQQIMKRIDAFGTISFPANGLERMEQLTLQIRSINSRLAACEQQKKQLEQQIAQATPNPSFDEHHLSLQQLINEWSQYEQWKNDLDKYTLELETIHEQLQLLLQELHLQHIDLERVEAIDVSIKAKEQLRSLLKQYDYLSLRRESLTKQRKDKKQELIAIEHNCNHLESQLMPEETFRRLSNKQHHLEHTKVLQAEYDRVQQQIEIMKNVASSRNTSGQMTIIMMAVFLLFAGFSLVMKHYDFLILSFVACIIVGIFMMKKGGQKQLNKQLSSLSEEAEKLKEQLNSEKNVHHNAHLYEQQKELREQWKNQVLQLEHIQHQSEQLEHEWQLLHKEHQRFIEQLNQMKKEMLLDIEFPSEQLMNAFDILVDIRKHLSKTKHINVLIQQLQRQRLEWKQELEQWFERLQFKWPSNFEGILLLKKALSDHQEKKIIYRELNNKRQELDNQEHQLKLEQQSVESDMQQLMSVANVENIEDYWNKGSNFETVEKLKERLALLSIQMSEEKTKGYQSIQDIHELERKQTSLISHVKDLTHQLTVTDTDLAKIKYELKQLEEGGTFTEKLHEFHYSKSQFQDFAKKWFKLALAKQILVNMMDKFRKQRFPKVLQMAETYLSMLTNGEYVSLHLHEEEDHFFIKRQDGVLFAPNELSQATAEQLYVSLRFALVNILEDEYACPIIIDDGFVNFDSRRTENVIELLKKMSKNKQVLFFTCHQYLLPTFAEEQIITLENGKLLNSL